MRPFLLPKRPLEAGIYGRSFPALKVPGWRAFCCVLVCDSMTSRFAVGSQELTAILTTNVIAI